jgi:hypothetical protein
VVAPADRAVSSGAASQRALFQRRTNLVDRPLRDRGTVPLGEPSPHLTPMQRAAWFSFAAEIPWLAESDRSILELACHVRGRLMAGEDLNAPLLTVLRQTLSAWGATPADRSRISAAKKPDDDPASIFFNA